MLLILRSIHQPSKSAGSLQQDYYPSKRTSSTIRNCDAKDVNTKAFPGVKCEKLADLFKCAQKTTEQTKTFIAAWLWGMSNFSLQKQRRWKHFVWFMSHISQLCLMLFSSTKTTDLCLSVCVCVCLPGNGEHGKPFPLTESDRVDQAYRENGFNIYISDRISLNRSLPDIRHVKLVPFSVCVWMSVYIVCHCKLIKM